MSTVLHLMIAMTAGATAIPGIITDAKEIALVSLETGLLPANMAQNNTVASIVSHDGENVMRVEFYTADWPNILFNAPEDRWDWRDCLGIAVDVFNPEPDSFPVCMRIDNPGADGMQNCLTHKTNAEPGKWTTFFGRLDHADTGPFWGMRGIPILGPVATGQGVDTSRISAFQIFLPMPSKPHTLLLRNLRLIKGPADFDLGVPFPFIDRFGQYKHADWPGKVHEDKDLTGRRDSEKESLSSVPVIPGRDSFGGWADGPTLEATGWFRTEKVDGKWWLVTPQGHIFFSIGMDCVGTWEQTFVEKRDDWFEWLPSEDDPLFASLYGNVENVHSMADVIGGKGRTFSFYKANLTRKYGQEWPGLWRQNTYARLRSWGFNTIANWSQKDVLENSPIPFVVSAGTGWDVRGIEGGGGYWSKMVDVYSEEFPSRTEASIASATQAYARNPLCIGYFVDNEISWEAVERGSLASPTDQPCRIAQVEKLKTKYASIQDLNKAWETDATDWDALRVPASPNATCQADLDEFVHAFATRYFETIKSALRKHAPNQLYLGCRFSTAPPPAVRACAEIADVVSFNLYQTHIDCARYTGDKDLDAPIIIGEFHFGALDRGMFHTGLVPTTSQHERAAAFARYVRSVADCPAFVGCHWFQYIDEPTTGRHLDGENYNIGFVSITDTPYPELVESARTVNAEIYERRHKSLKP